MKETKGSLLAVAQKVRRLALNNAHFTDDAVTAQEVADSYRATAEGILDSLDSERGSRDYVDSPLTGRQVLRVAKMLGFQASRRYGGFDYVGGESAEAIAKAAREVADQDDASASVHFAERRGRMLAKRIEQAKRACPPVDAPVDVKPENLGGPRKWRFDCDWTPCFFLHFSVRPRCDASYQGTIDVGCSQ